MSVYLLVCHEICWMLGFKLLIILLHLFNDVLSHGNICILMKMHISCEC